MLDINYISVKLREESMTTKSRISVKCQEHSYVLNIFNINPNNNLMRRCCYYAHCTVKEIRLIKQDPCFQRHLFSS